MMEMKIGNLALRSFQAMDYTSLLVRSFISQTVLLPQVEAALHGLDIHNS
jgi:membrane protein YqaA with SNARE-associated domain